MERIEIIKKELCGYGPKADVLYTNEEIVSELKLLQSLLARGVFEKTHAENLKDRDLMIHFDALAKEYDLDKTDTYLRFKKNMGDLSYTIGSFIKGFKGEKIARKALKLISLDRGVKVLYNVQLEDDDCQAEYDAIVITPYGLFVIEVKNWGNAVAISPMGLLTRGDESSVTYDLPGRMSVKEALLRECLKDKFPGNYNSILLLSNERVQIEDSYHRIPICCGGGISYEIRSYEKISTKLLSEREIDEIATIILGSQKEQKSSCPVNCEEIISDYAELMVLIENASKSVDENTIVDTSIKEGFIANEQDKEDKEGKEEPWYAQNGWKIALGSIAIAIPVALTAIVLKRD